MMKKKSQITPYAATCNDGGPYWEGAAEKNPRDCILKNHQYSLPNLACICTVNSYELMNETKYMCYLSRHMLNSEFRYIKLLIGELSFYTEFGNLKLGIANWE